MFCHVCGKELSEGAAYCPSCGAKVGAYSPADWWWERRRDRWERHDWEPTDAAWGAVRAVGFLVILGLTFVSYPDVLTLFSKYLQSWQTYGHPVLPPHVLGVVLIFLFTAGGVWGLVSSGLRLVFSRRLRRPLLDVIGAFFSLYVAFILEAFYARTFGGADLVLAFFVGLAALILVNALIALFVPRRRRATES